MRTYRSASGTEAFLPFHFRSELSVANESASALSRTFANRDFFSGSALRAVIWSILASFCLVVLLPTLAISLELITNLSPLSVEMTSTELKEFNRFTGMHVHHVGPVYNEPDQPPDREVRRRFQSEDDPEEDATSLDSNEVAASSPRTEKKAVHDIYGEGILRSVWDSRDHWYGELFAMVFRRVDLLQHTEIAMMALFTLVIGLWLLRQWCLSRIHYHSQRAALRVAVSFRNHLHRQVMRLSPEEIDEQSARSAVDLFTFQVDGVRYGLENWISRLAQYPLELACLIGLALSVDPLMTVQWSIPLLLCMFLVERSTTRIAAARRLTDDRLRDEYQALSQQMLNARLVRGFGMEQLDHESFIKRLERTLLPPKELFPSQRRALWFGRLTTPICAVLCLFLAISLGLKLIREASELSIAEATLFVLCALLALRSARELWTLNTVKEGIALAASHLYRYLDRLPSVSQAVGAKFLQPLGRTIHFDAVSYRSATEKPVLERITLNLAAKKSYAIVSLNPLEAKAFALMLPRFIEPQAGRILFDGEDIAWATLESLRAEAMFVGGDDAPLRGTVLENLRAGNNRFSLQQATDAAKQTHSHNFFMRLSQGYETLLTGDDTELDASQRFRLSLTRAVLHNPALLIIEEPKINFDDDTKQLLDDAYQRLLVDRTLIFLPSRLSTLKRVDQVIVLNNGQIAAQGPQSVLINESSVYRHWEYLHFNEFRRLDAARSNGMPKPL